MVLSLEKMEILGTVLTINSHTKEVDMVDASQGSVKVSCLGRVFATAVMAWNKHYNLIPLITPPNLLDRFFLICCW